MARASAGTAKRAAVTSDSEGGGLRFYRVGRVGGTGLCKEVVRRLQTPIPTLGPRRRSHRTSPVENLAMLLSVAILAIGLQQPQYRDSAEVARLLASLRTSDPAVCQMAGRALT